MVWILLLIIFGMLLLKCEWERYVWSKKLAHFDGPPTLPVFGALLPLLTSPTNIFSTYKKLRKPFIGKTNVLWLFHKPYIMVSNPKDVPLACKEIKKHSTYAILAEMLGDGLITAAPERWKKTRGILNPSFNSPSSAEYSIEIFNQKSAELVETLKTKEGFGKSFNAYNHIMKTLFSIVYETTLGVQHKDFENEALRNHHNLTWTRANAITFLRFLFPPIRSSFIRDVIFRVCNLKTFLVDVREPHTKAIQTRRKILLEKNENEDANPLKKKPMFDILFEKNILTDQELTEEIITLLFAGSHTSTNAIGYTLLYLGQRTDIQEQVYKEIVENCGEHDRFFQKEDLAKLTFLGQVLKETLRLYPIIPIIARQATDDIVLSDDRVIPAGASFVIPIFEIQLNPDYYSDPMTWDPHNFDPEKVADRPPFTFLPYGCGPRTCIGNKYAMLVMKTIVATLIRNFRIVTTEKIMRAIIGFHLVNEGGYHIMLNKR